MKLLDVVWHAGLVVVIGVAAVFTRSVGWRAYDVVVLVAFATQLSRVVRIWRASR